MIVYTLVGSLLMLVAAIATAILAADQVGHLSFSIADLRAHVARRPAARTGSSASSPPPS